MNIADWIGRKEIVSDVITAMPVAALSATLNRPAQRPATGTVLPAVWHWLYFVNLYQQSEAGHDGHPTKGGFLPPIELPRRMWAGSQIAFAQHLRVGDTVRRESTIADVNDKSGRSGRLVFVKVNHKLFRGDESIAAIDEFHDIVYRQAPKADDKPVPPQVAPQLQSSPSTSTSTSSLPHVATALTWERKIVPDSLLLFRYSALTFNGHRIHYDQPYVTQVEGYPGLVVHGPLIATLLLDGLRHQLADVDIASYSFRAVRPTFDTDHFFVCGQQDGDKSFHLWAKDHQGWLTMDAKVTIR